MANRTLNMVKLKRAFQMLSASTPQREICAQLHIGRGVLNRYKKLADEAKVAYGTIGRMSEEQIHGLLQSAPTPKPSEQKKELDDLLPDYVEDLAKHRHLTIQLLHEEYLKTHPNGYAYTQFKKRIRDYQYAHNLSYHNTYIPGYEMQIDFAGDRLYVTDQKSQEHIPVVVLCCILPFSGMGYAKAMYHANMEFFFCGLSDALTYFGGSPEVCKSDNMTQWVKKSDRYEPTFNDAAIEWSSYYETSLEACRVRKPRDKGPVEGIVNKFYQFVYAAIRHEVFHSLDKLNSRIFELTDMFNDRPSKTTGKSRRHVYEAEERESLGPLPASPFRFRYRKEVKIAGDYHVPVGRLEERHLYSVPYTCVGQKVTVIWDTETVEVYLNSQRIALHRRRFTTGHTTEDAHMPENHREYRHTQGRNAAFYLEEAEAIGAYTRMAVEKVLASPKYVSHAYRSCEGILSLRRKYGKERLENACKRVSESGSVSYSMLRNILQGNLDKTEIHPNVSRTPANEYVRGADAFSNI